MYTLQSYQSDKKSSNGKYSESADGHVILSATVSSLTIGHLLRCLLIVFGRLVKSWRGPQGGAQGLFLKSLCTDLAIPPQEKKHLWDMCQRELLPHLHWQTGIWVILKWKKLMKC